MVFDADIIRDDAVGTIVGKGDAPHIGTYASQALDDGLTVASDATVGGVEQNFAPGVAEDGYGDYIVGE